MSPRRPPRSPFRERAALRQMQVSQTSPGPRIGEPMSVHRVSTGADLLALDHVGLSVADPQAMADFLCDHVGMHRLVGEADLTVVGAGGRAATLKLAAAAGPREPGALVRLVLRVADVAGAVAMLPAATAVEGDRLERATFWGPEGLGLGFTMVAGGGIDYDLDHVVLRCHDPEQTRAALAEAGFVPRGQALHVADKYVTLTKSPGRTARPLLNHIGVRVDDVAAVAREPGLDIGELATDGAGAIVLPGPEQIGLHFVTQTPHG